MGRTVLVTGAAGGVGAALVRNVLDKGWTPLAVSRQPARLADLAAQGVICLSHDVSTYEGARAAVREAGERLGAVPDALVNCAGEVLIAPLHRTTEAQYRRCLAANLDTAFFTLGAWVDALRAAPKPAVAVLVSSVAAGTGLQNHEAVAAAKAGVEALVRTAAATYASGTGGFTLRINGVAPGLVETPATAAFVKTEAGRKQMAAQYPLGRYGQPEDIAAAITWLLADDSAWVNGQVLGVDGGLAAVRPLVRAAP